MELCLGCLGKSSMVAEKTSMKEIHKFSFIRLHSSNIILASPRLSQVPCAMLLILPSSLKEFLVGWSSTQKNMSQIGSSHPQNSGQINIHKHIFVKNTYSISHFSLLRGCLSKLPPTFGFLFNPMIFKPTKKQQHMTTVDPSVVCLLQNSGRTPAAWIASVASSTAPT